MAVETLVRSAGLSLIVGCFTLPHSEALPRPSKHEELYLWSLLGNALTSDSTLQNLEPHDSAAVVPATYWFVKEISVE